MKINELIVGLCLSFALTPAFAAEQVDLPIPRSAEQIPAQIVVQLSTSEKATVRFPTCGGCGYQWTVISGETDLLSQIKKGREDFPPNMVEINGDLPLVGSATVSTFVFPKMTPGRHVFTLAYIAPGARTTLTREVVLDVTASADRWK